MILSFLVLSSKDFHKFRRALSFFFLCMSLNLHLEEIGMVDTFLFKKNFKEMCSSIPKTCDN